MRSMPQEPKKSRVYYGTFLGVFTPSILTIFGAIMYLRFGWVVGNAGVFSTLLIVVLANIITLITAFSVSSLATSMRVGVGGAYYLISRSLGLEVGGAIGLPLYLSQTISLTLYSYALAETVRFAWPSAPLMPFAALFVVLVTILASKSTQLMLKAQVVILVAVGLSIISLFAGANWGAPLQATGSTYSAAPGGFWEVFAVFFPAVTGILTGLGLSGDLKDPERSLPIGTLSAVGVGFAIYLIIPYALALHGNRNDLIENPMVWLDIAHARFLIVPGLILAIFSSAIGSVLAAPRTLQALAEDSIIPWFLAKTVDGEPKLAIRVSGAVALAAVLLGDLNSVAIAVTLFFLTTYGMINVVVALEEMVGNPSFRPRFHMAWPYALGAALACFAVMFLIHPVASLMAITVEVLLYLGLSRRTLTAAWGDMRAGIHMAAARWLLLRQRFFKSHPRNWRPHILVFTPDVEKNLIVIRAAMAFSQNRGIVTVATLLTEEQEPTLSKLSERTRVNQEILERNGLHAFCEVDVVSDLGSGMLTVAQANGIAGLQSNTIVLGWPEHQKLVSTVRIMRKLDQLGKSLLIMRLKEGNLPKPRRIDLWWSGREDNGDLMLLLAYLLTLGKDWRHAQIHLKTIAESTEDGKHRKASLKQMAQETRIAAHPEVIVHEPGASVPTIIQEHSQDAALVMLGLGIPEPGQADRYAKNLEALVEKLPSVVLVRNSGAFRGELL
ncbi:MAG: Na-K-Cl cotransporter [Myxococcota bacterium]|nr:Na-K-Cl cotransporter [Myxococcota bacterium]